MSCENRNGCDFYQKMLPLFEKHIGSLSEKEKNLLAITVLIFVKPDWTTERFAHSTKLKHVVNTLIARQ